MRICSVEGCGEKHEAKGYCIKHYTRLLRHGSPLITKRNHERHGLKKIPEYNTWIGLKSRCYNSKNDHYKYYGDRGIIVCDRWKNSFMAFYEDMGNRPFPDDQIDRIDNDGNYTPENCRWTSALENIRNAGRTKLDMAKACEIRALYKIGAITQLMLAKMYNVSREAISSVVTNRRWHAAAMVAEAEKRVQEEYHGRNGKM